MRGGEHDLILFYHFVLKGWPGEVLSWALLPDIDGLEIPLDRLDTAQELQNTYTWRDIKRARNSIGEQ
jgi:hypothetical protein